MPEYLPLLQPGNSVTRDASAVTTGGQLLRVSGEGVVAPTPGPTSSVIGVAGHDANPGDHSSSSWPEFSA